MIQPAQTHVQCTRARLSSTSAMNSGTCALMLGLASLVACCAGRQQADCPPSAGGKSGFGGTSLGGGGSTHSGGVGQGGDFDIPNCELPKRVLLDVPFSPQERSLSCWAATGQMVSTLLGRAHSQCEQINWRLNAGNSCACDTCPRSANIPVGDCNNGGFPDFGRLNVHAIQWQEDTPMPLPLLKRVLGCAKSPVAFSWHYDDKGGHMMLARGYTGDMIEIYNPNKVCMGSQYAITYEQYSSGYNAFTRHWNDFFDLKRKPPQ